MTSSFTIMDSMRELRSTASDALHSEGLPLSYKSALKELAKKLPGGLLVKVSQDRQAIALKRWLQAKQSNAIDNLLQDDRTVRILCSISEVATDGSFLNHLINRSKPTTSRMLQSLMHSYHNNWREHESHGLLERYLQKELPKCASNNKAILQWISNIDHVIGDHAPIVISGEMCQRLQKIDQVCHQYNLSAQNSPFCRTIIVSAAEKLSETIAGANRLSLTQWDFLFDELLSSPVMLKSNREVVLARLIRSLDRKLSDAIWRTAQEAMKDFLLAHSEFGDPRIHPQKWGSFDPEARQIVISWLSEEDLRIFFDLLVKNDPHGRKPFWLKYLKQVRGSRVIIGDKDVWQLQSQLSELKKKGRSYARGAGLETHAFILEFGEYVAVEFSEVSNACYIYDSKTFAKHFGTIYKPNFNLSGLKNKTIAEYRQSHHSNWQSQLRQELARLGIRMGV